MTLNEVYTIIDSDNLIEHSSSDCIGIAQGQIKDFYCSAYSLSYKNSLASFSGEKTHHFVFFTFSIVLDLNHCPPRLFYLHKLIKMFSIDVLIYLINQIIVVTNSLVKIYCITYVWSVYRIASIFLSQRASNELSSYLI